MIELGDIFYMPPDKAVKLGIRFVENAYPDAIGAIALIPHPELEAFFRIDIPFVNPVVIGYRGALLGWPIKTDGLSRACLGTLSANFAHLFDANFNGFIRYQRQIGEYFANPYPWTETGCD